MSESAAGASGGERALAQAQRRPLESRERPILLESRGQALRALGANLIVREAASEVEGQHSWVGRAKANGRNARDEADAVARTRAS